MSVLKPLVAELPVFDRKFWDGTFRCTQIGSGLLGGKANGLVFMKDLLAKRIDPKSFSDVDINVLINSSARTTLPSCLSTKCQMTASPTPSRSATSRWNCLAISAR